MFTPQNFMSKLSTIKIEHYQNIYLKIVLILIGSNPCPLDVTESERARMISEAVMCYLCHKRFEDQDIKCLDHNHVLSGRPLGISKKKKIK